LYRRAIKPLPKKLDPRTNKPVKRVVKLMSNVGDVLHESEVGTFYPIGGEKVILTKADIERIKNFDSPGMTLVGFKPRSKLKLYHNYRTSYFIYPD
jgi:ATP-dependent DNA helicase 2 subunit 1